jgi:hypothetical protein
VALGVPCRLRPRIFSTFCTARVVVRRPKAPAAFTPGEIPGTHFQRLSLPQGTWFCRKEPRKKSQVTPPGIDHGTVRLVAQRPNHYATPGPMVLILMVLKFVDQSLLLGSPSPEIYTEYNQLTNTLSRAIARKITHPQIIAEARVQYWVSSWDLWWT